MKRNILCLAISLFSSLAFAGVITIDGKTCPIDTLEYYQVGPGTMYCKFQVQIRSAYQNFYMLTVDLNNQYNTIEAFQSTFAKRVTLANAYAQMNTTNHQPIGGVNCNFWQVSASTNDCSGMPQSATAHAGVLNSEPSSWILEEWHQKGSPSDDPSKVQGLTFIDNHKHVIIDSVYWEGKIFYGNNQTYKIREVNRPRINPKDNEIAFFHSFMGDRKTRKPSEFTTDSLKYGVYNLYLKIPQLTINDTIKAVVEKIDTIGGLSIPNGYAVLQGRGKGATALKTFKIGDTVPILLAIRTRRDNLLPNIQEMVTGNALVMENGVINQRNYNDLYNYKQYPRSGLGTNDSGDKFWMMTSEKPGVYTYEMCEIFKYAGATFVSALDGGGSAQMALFDKVQNPTTESTPRAVVNQMWAISTAPEDNAVASIQFVDNLKSVVPNYSDYVPSIRAYNQYGVLLSSNYQDYTLSCEPANLGTISEDGKTFTAGSICQTGTLYVRSGNAVAQKTIEIQEGSVSFRLDSVLIDKREYVIEVCSSNGKTDFKVNPASLTYEIADNAICKVEDGTLCGTQNGVTMLIGSLSQFSDTMKVTVEIPQTPTLPVSIFPADTTFQIASARNAILEILNNLRFFGCPDSVQICVTSDVNIKAALFEWTLNNAKEPMLVNNDTKVPAGTHTYTLRPADFVEGQDIAIFPITFSRMKLTFDGAKTKQDYHLNTKITAFYPNSLSTGLEQLKKSDSPVQLIYQNGQIVIKTNGNLYSLTGQIIK